MTDTGITKCWDMNGTEIPCAGAGQYGSDCSLGSPAPMNWHQAQTACTDLNPLNSGAGYAGRTDWRLPSIDR